MAALLLACFRVYSCGPNTKFLPVPSLPFPELRSLALHYESCTCLHPATSALPPQPFCSQSRQRMERVGGETGGRVRDRGEREEKECSTTHCGAPLHTHLSLSRHHPLPPPNQSGLTACLCTKQAGRLSSLVRVGEHTISLHFLPQPGGCTQDGNEPEEMSPKMEYLFQSKGV
jgi:hypothetical protein